MDKTLNQKYDIGARIELQQRSSSEISIVKRMKSRIIRKDALRIIEIADKIRSVDQNIKVSLVCNNNICSKSLLALKEASIVVYIANE